MTPAMAAEQQAEKASACHRNSVRPKLLRDRQRYLPCVAWGRLEAPSNWEVATAAIEPIEAAQFGAERLPLEHDELLANNCGLQSELLAWHEEGAEVGDHRESERNH